jgi:hypothetical protein
MTETQATTGNELFDQAAILKVKAEVALRTLQEVRTHMAKMYQFRDEVGLYDDMGRKAEKIDQDFFDEWENAIFPLLRVITDAGLIVENPVKY